MFALHPAFEAARLKLIYTDNTSKVNLCIPSRRPEHPITKKGWRSTF
jgi:hypothetical protein